MNYEDQNDDVLATEVHRRGFAYTPSEALDLGRARMIELLVELDSFEEPISISTILEDEGDGQWIADVRAEFGEAKFATCCYSDTEHEAVIGALKMLLAEAIHRLDQAIRDAEGTPI